MTMEGDQRDLKTRCGSNWSNLPEDLLDDVLKRLSLTCFLLLGSVCKSWRHAMSARRRLTCPPLLLRMLSEENQEECDDISSTHDFYCLFQGKYEKLPLKLHIQDLYSIPYCGPSEGWSAVIDELGKKYLLNLFSGDRICLPLVGIIYNVAFSSSPTSDDCTIIAYTYGGRIVSRKGGEKNWKKVFDNLSAYGTVSGMAFHKGKFYLLFRNGDCRVYDTDEAQPRLVDVVLLLDRVAFDENYLKLVESGDELLMVACLNPLIGFPMDFKVFRLQDSEGEVKRWVQIKSLGDQVLFLSNRRAQSISTKEFIYSDFRSNCIYFHWDWQSYVQVYSMEDGSCRNWHIPFNYLQFFGFV